MTIDKYICMAFGFIAGFYGAFLFLAFLMARKEEEDAF